MAWDIYSKEKHLRNDDAFLKVVAAALAERGRQDADTIQYERDQKSIVSRLWGAADAQVTALTAKLEELERENIEWQRIAINRGTIGARIERERDALTTKLAGLKETLEKLRRKSSVLLTGVPSILCGDVEEIVNGLAAALAALEETKIPIDTPQKAE